MTVSTCPIVIYPGTSCVEREEKIRPSVVGKLMVADGCAACVVCSGTSCEVTSGENTYPCVVGERFVDVCTVCLVVVTLVPLIHIPVRLVEHGNVTKVSFVVVFILRIATQ